MENKDLKPCPNCKSNLIEVTSKPHQGWKITCKICGYFCHLWPFASLTEVVEAWNEIDRTIKYG